MTTNSSASKTINLTDERKDVRIFATDEETLNEETALKIECNYANDIKSLKFQFPEEFRHRKHLHILIDTIPYAHEGFLDKYRVEFLKTGDKKYVGKESFDHYDFMMDHWKTGLYDAVTNWAEGQQLDIKIKKYRKPTYKSPSKYFSKKENYVRTLLRNKKRVELSKDERRIVEHLFNVHSFNPEWFFETSDINKELQLSGQMFDKIIESLIEKKLLEKELFGGGYSLYATI